ncbi:MAG: protein-glutamine gamma-glutamyltransferase [Pyrinomonadaceae bacterium]|jgi:transglutaminase-like putative cysteine protease|nr:protein-glutamine gamma-glutamyltransferase [Pyrinomonadaceae bacterium]
MTLENYFRAFSYATVAVATLALVLAGGLNLALALLFFAVLVGAWNLEGRKWQLSERLGLVAVLVSVPLFLLDWKYQNNVREPAGQLGVAALAHLIVFLAAVKLLQHKKDRDWVFLYLISFFEILLAAGLSFSPVFLASLSVYMLCGLTTIVAFEIHKTKRSMAETETRLLVAPDSGIFKHARRYSKRSVEARRLPLVAFFLFLLIFILALPLFLLAPRSGAAMLGRSGSSLSNFIGFSENVTLGAIGTLKRDSAIVMHVRLEEASNGREFRWRGVALDEFTGRAWRKSPEARRPVELKNERGFYQLGTTESLHRLTAQTIFLEAIESPVLFAAPRPVAIQGDFSAVRMDAEGSVQARRRQFERVVYKALSDTTAPDEAVLRRDVTPYPVAFQRYLQLPLAIDPRINARTNAMVANAHARNRYDEARAIESQLQSEYGYSLDMKAGGSDPLADFLFNVKVGHCEYFATAMAVMLRTRGIATRVVNGFLPGEYNEAAGAFTVRQSDAHSWVEVYFPETNSWVTFDPTPAAGRDEPIRSGVVGQLEKYAEAFELMWFQYVVGYDKQEQRSLATSLQNRLVTFRHFVSSIFNRAVKLLPKDLRSVVPVGLTVAAALVLFLSLRRLRRFGWRRAFRRSDRGPAYDQSMVLFYENLTSLLAQRGIRRDADLTPLEFAGSLDVPEALKITRAYNRVRFGHERLLPEEIDEIQEALISLERLSET